MASLDDFFAKRDKKKGKGKKFTTTDEIAKNIEEGGKKVEKPEVKPKKERVKGTDEENPTEVTGNDAGDEWKEYKEETEKDYSGLKIQKLQIAEPDEEPDNTEGERQEGETQGSRNVWKVSAAEEAQEQVEKPVTPEPEAPKEELAAEPSAVGENSREFKSAYVPPHLRNRQDAPAAAPTRAQPRGRPRVAPDITSEEYFPSLSQGAGNAKS